MLKESSASVKRKRREARPASRCLGALCLAACLANLLHRIAPATAGEHPPHAVETLRRAGVRFPQVKFPVRSLRPDHALGMNDAVKARLLELRQRLLGGGKRRTERQGED